jgi:hypothetical protein
MKVGNQIQLSECNGRCVLEIYDAELCDFVEDFFAQQGLEFQVIFPATNTEPHKLLFESGVSVQAVSHLLSEMSQAEIERIASINANY